MNGRLSALEAEKLALAAQLEATQRSAATAAARLSGELLLAQSVADEARGDSRHMAALADGRATEAAAERAEVAELSARLAQAARDTRAAHEEATEARAALRALQEHSSEEALQAARAQSRLANDVSVAMQMSEQISSVQRQCEESLTQVEVLQQQLQAREAEMHAMRSALSEAQLARSAADETVDRLSALVEDYEEKLATAMFGAYGSDAQPTKRRFKNNSGGGGGGGGGGTAPIRAGTSCSRVGAPGPSREVGAEAIFTVVQPHSRLSTVEIDKQQKQLETQINALKSLGEGAREDDRRRLDALHDQLDRVKHADRRQPDAAARPQSAPRSSLPAVVPTPISTEDRFRPLVSDSNTSVGPHEQAERWGAPSTGQEVCTSQLLALSETLARSNELSPRLTGRMHSARTSPPRSESSARSTRIAGAYTQVELQEIRGILLPKSRDALHARIRDLVPREIAAVDEDTMKWARRIVEDMHEHRTTIKLVFVFYAWHSVYRTERPVFALSMTQLRLLIKDIKASAEVITQLGTIIKKVKHTVDVEGIPPDSVLFDEFLEALIRTAAVQFKRSTMSLPERVAAFFEQHLLPFAKRFTPDGFRQRVFQREDVRAALDAYGRPLHELFKIVAFGYTNGSGEFVDFKRRHSVSMAEFFAFLRRHDLITAKLTVAKSVNIFMASSYTEGPDSWEEWKWEMEFEQFQESLCRVALLMFSRQRFEILYTHCTSEVCWAESVLACSCTLALGSDGTHVPSWARAGGR